MQTAGIRNGAFQHQVNPTAVVKAKAVGSLAARQSRQSSDSSALPRYHSCNNPPRRVSLEIHGDVFRILYFF